MTGAEAARAVAVWLRNPKMGHWTFMLLKEVMALDMSVKTPKGFVWNPTATLLALMAALLA